jgi:DNA-binding transcriptional ArsR family regulator
MLARVRLLGAAVPYGELVMIIGEGECKFENHLLVLWANGLVDMHHVTLVEIK